jgi:hypothetical protein
MPHRPSASRAMLLALAVAGLARAAAAADRVLSDPSFLPSQGQVLGTSTFNHAVTNLTYEGAQLLVTDQRTLSSNQWVQAFAYGVTDDLDLRLNGSLMWQQEQNAPVSGPETDTDSRGPEDPSVGATWRFWDQDRAPFNGDLIAGYTPGLFSGEASTVSKTGTVGLGAQVATLGAAASLATRYVTLYTDLEGSYLGPRHYTNVDGSVTAYDGYFLGTLSLNSQFRFSGVFSMNAGMTGYWNNAYHAVNQASGTDFESAGDNEIDYNVALNLHILLNRLVASLVYNNATYSFGTDVYPAHPSSDTTTAYQNAQTLGLRLEYIFL